MASAPAAAQESLDDLRTQGHALAQAGRCAEALAFLLKAAELSGAPRDRIAVANCYIENGQPYGAATALYAALAKRERLRRDEVIYALDALGHQQTQLANYAQAAEAWRQLLALREHAETRLNLARSVRLTGDLAAARSALTSVDPSKLQGAALAIYYEEVFYANRDTAPEMAIAAMERAIEIEDRAYRRAELASFLQSRYGDGRTIEELERAYRLEPNNANLILSLAYAYLRAGRNEEAIALFRKGLALDPEAVPAYEDLAYTLKKEARNREAIEAFKVAIDNKPRYPQDTAQEQEELERRIYRFRREVAELDRDFYLNAFLVYRASAIANPFVLPETGPITSQAGIEAGWRPPKIGYRNGRIFEVYTRVFGSFVGDDLVLDDDGVQGGVGLRYKPFTSQDLRLSAERLFKIGDRARDAWLLSASYFWGDGVELKPFDDHWNYTSIFAQVAYIPDDPEFLSLFFEAMQGRSFRLGNRTTLTPHIVFADSYADDGPTARNRAEAGAGLALTYYFRETAYKAPQSSITLRAQYRFSVAADKFSGDDVFITGIFLNF